MSFYSQKDPKWASTKLGNCTTTMGQSSCFITSACNLFPRIVDFSMNPSELNKYCTKNGVYSNGCMLNASILASKFGMIYEKTTTKPKVTCIAETDHWKSAGVPQHFYMIKPDGTIIDPLDKNPDFKKNPYNVISYRVFTAVPKKEEPKIDPVKTSEVKTVETPVVEVKTQPETILSVKEQPALVTLSKLPENNTNNMQIKNTFTSIEFKNTILHFSKVLGVTLLILILQQAQGIMPDKYIILVPFITSLITSLQEYLRGE